MRVQIGLCTWNRASLLESTLERLAQLQVPEQTQLQVIVVDNGSTDTTPQVLDAFENRLPLLRCVERQLGHSHARNRAVSAADGDLLIWIDDDVLPEPGWLPAYVKACREQPGASFWGGPIVPKFCAPVPAWITQNWDLCQGCFAARDLGSEPCDLSPARLPYGANLAIRTRVQKEFLFDTQLGRVGNRLRGDDEIDMLRRAISREHRGVWVPLARVQHLIPEPRMRERAIADYYAAQGEREASSDPGGSRAGLVRERLWQQSMYRIKRYAAPSRVWLSHLIRAALARGRARHRAKR